MQAIVCGVTKELPDPQNNQAVFDYVVEHLFTQKEPAYDDGESGCRYRWSDRESDNPRMLACAAGCLIPDDEYKIEFEGGSVSDTILDVKDRSMLARNVGNQNPDEYRFGYGASNVSKFIREYFKDKGYDQRLLHALQEAHDTREVHNWKFYLQNIAFAFGLSTAKLDALGDIV